MSLALGLALSHTVHAQSLVDLFGAAKQYDATYRGAQAQYEANKAKADQVISAIFPTINLQTNATRTHANANSTSSTFTFDRYYSTPNMVLSLNQPLYRPANLLQYEQSKLQLAQAVQTLVTAEQDLIVRVSQAYFDVLVSQDSLSFVLAQKAAVAEQLAAAKRNFEVGTATITDTNEAQARYDLAVAQEISAENDLQVKRAALQQITGKAPGELVPLRTGVQLPAPQPSAIDQWVTSAEQDNIGVRVAQANAEIASREISKARAGHYPTVDLVASYARSYNPTTASLDRMTSTQAGIQVSVPLFAGFAVQSRVTQTVALEDQAKQNLEAAKRTAAQGARAAYLGVTNGLAQVKALEAAERSSQTALEANQLGYKVGVRVNIDVLNSQQQLYQTRRDLSKARYDTLLGALKLKSAAGRLAEADIEQVDTLFSK